MQDFLLDQMTLKCLYGVDVAVRLSVSLSPPLHAESQ